MKKKEILLACESSCDETAFSLYNIHTDKIIASSIESQIHIHKKNGGVIPDLAASYHFSTILPLCLHTLEKAQMTIDDVDYFCATKGPGLPGALLIGYTFTKGLAWSKKKPFFGINHLEGHIYSSFLNNADIPFPHLCLSVSGGHTALYKVNSLFDYTLLGWTRDDAAGECFDKIAKLLGLPYPGGREIELLAAKNAPIKNERKYPISVLEDGSISFSGLKTAVLYDLIKTGHYDKEAKQIKPDATAEYKQSVAESTQYAITKMLRAFLKHHLEKETSIRAITLVGGVACNTIIRNAIQELALSRNISFFCPEKKYCCDNADMIAFVASQKIKNNKIESSYQESILQ
jgi:N6-L-threonylcarbamoyladenine synthase